MSARLARLALALYPLAYRRRYGAEMAALLEDSGATPAAALDLLRGAVTAHLRPAPGVNGAVGREERVRHGLAAVLACWILFAIAGLAFYKTVEGVPFEAVPSLPSALGVLHRAIQILATIGGVAVLAGAAPFALAALREARASGVRRRPLSIQAPSRGLGWASRCAIVAALAMLGIAALTAAYLVVLGTSAPDLAGEPNGPFGTPDVAISVALQLALMVLVSAPAALAAARARRTLAR